MKSEHEKMMVKLQEIVQRADDKHMRLMAAAPQLAAVLREVADFCAGEDAPQELTDKINAALAKAGV